MKKILFFLLIIQIGYSQEKNKPLLREILYQELADLNNPHTFLSGSRYTYKYDSKYRLITESTFHNNGLSWSKRTEGFYKYDFSDRPIEIRTVRFNRNEYGVQEAFLTTVQQNVYMGDRLTSYAVLHDWHQEGRIDSMIFFYDEFGRTFLRRFKIINLIENEWSDRYHFAIHDENGCIAEIRDSVISQASGQVSINLNTQIFSNDSDCRITEVKHYYQEDGGDPFLQSTTRYSRLKDELDNVIIEEQFYKDELVDDHFYKVSKDTFAYDEHGNEILKETTIYDHGIEVHKFRISRIFDDDGLITLERSEGWDYDIGNWQTWFEKEMGYHENGKIEFEEFHTNWDQETSTFLSNKDVTYTYNSLDTIISILSNAEDLENPSRPVRYTEELIYEYGCDQRLLNYKFVYSNKLNFSRHPSIATFTYFDLPECEQLNSPQLTLEVFPNPTSDFVHLLFNEIVDNVIIEVFSASGKKLESFVLNQVNYKPIDMSAYPEGLYVIYAVDGQKTLEKKIVKVR